MKFFKAIPKIIFSKSILCLICFGLLMLTSQKAHSTVAPPCSGAFALGNSPVCKDSVWSYSGEQWFSFTANSDSLTVEILNSTITTDGHAHKMYLYQGPCGSETLISSDSLTGPADSTLQITYSSFIPGNVYLVQVLSNQPGCGLGCGVSPAGFEICIKLIEPSLFNNFTLAFFQQGICGLDYVMGAVRLNQRPTNVGVGLAQPAAINIAGIPPGANIIAAFLWYTCVGVTPNPMPFTLNNVGFNGVITGGGTGFINSNATCWAGFGTTTTCYRANVTAVVTGNGAYAVAGLPNNMGPTDTDGATLVVIYSTCNSPSSVPASLYIYDGISIIVGNDVETPLLGPFASFTPNINGRVLYSIGDVQNNVPPPPPANSQTTCSFNANNQIAAPIFWEAVNVASAFGNAQANMLFTHTSNGPDCSVIPFIGVYFQDGAPVVQCTPLSATAVPPIVNFCKSGPFPTVVNIGASGTGGNPGYTYLWSPSTGVACTTCQNTTVTINGPGFSIYTVTVTDAAGCTVTATVTITPIDPPSAAISGPTSNPCDGLGVVYSGAPNPNVTYTWIVDYAFPTPPNADFTVSSTNPSVLVPADDGGWTITLQTCYTNIPTCCSTSTLIIDRCCPCPTGSFCFNNTNANSVIASFGNTLTSAGGDPIVINGVLDVNANLTFNGFDGNTGTNDIRLSTNAKIIIRSGMTLTIDDCLLRDNCFKMWDGIYIEDQTAKLIIRNGSIATGAKNAVVSQQGGVYELTNSIFENNYKCVVVQAFNGTHQGFIRTCIFRTNPSVLFPQALPPLPGNPTRNDVGVEIINVRDITIGDASQAAYLNLFNNMDFGIRCTTSLLTRVVNNRFQNITSGVPLFSGYAVYGIGSLATDPPVHKLIAGGSAPNELNTFLNCVHGIFATDGINLDAINNNLNNTTITGTDGIVSRASQNATINIIGNSINRFRTGIWCLDDILSLIDIQFNSLNMTSVVPMTFGIRMENAVLGGVDANVRQNEIRRCLTGVFMINYTTLGSTRPRIRYNNIGFDMTNPQIFAPPAGPRFGIRVVASPGAFVDVNDVTRNYSTVIPAKFISGPLPIASLDVKLVGIYVQNSANSTVSNNNIARMGSGVIMDASNPGAKLTCNNFYRNYNAFHFGPPVNPPYYSGTTNIGVDQFAGQANDNVYKFVITGFANSVSGCDLLGSCFPPIATWNFRVTPPPAIYTPMNCSPAFITMVGVGQFSPTACDPVGPPLAPMVRQNSWQGVVQNQLTYQQFNSENQLTSRRIAFRYFKDNPGMLSLSTPDDSIYQNFFSTQSSSTTGQLERVLDEIYSGNVLNASNINNSVSPSCNIENLRKVVNAIYLNTWASGSREFSPADSNTLFTIAYGDPIEWGDAVYSAQVMMGIYPDPVNPLREMNEGNDTEDSSTDAQLYPNPAKDEITLEFSVGAEAYVEIYSALGQKVLKQQLDLGNVHSIEIKNLPEGVYLYVVKQSGEAILTGKVSIIH